MLYINTIKRQKNNTFEKLYVCVRDINIQKYTPKKHLKLVFSGE